MIALSIIIINYKSTQLVIDCLETVYAETKEIFFEIIVVDNDSRDDSRQKLLHLFPGIRWIQMNYNAGFARANNEGIRQSAGAAILLLNADTLIENHGIENCYEQFSNSEYLACGVQLINEDRTPQISGNYFVPGGLNYLLPLPFIGRFVKSIAKIFGRKAPHVQNANSVVEVDWINGAFLMVRKSAIEKAGYMDEDFFLYAEEAEWCGRIKRYGKLCIFGSVKIVHLQGEISSKTFNSVGKGYSNLFDKKGLQIMLSNLVRIRKQYGVAWFLFDLFFYILEVPFFFIGILFHNIFSKKENRYSFLQFTGYCRNIFALIGFTPVIVRNKPHFYKVL